MSDDLETTVTLRMVYDAVLALVNESQQQRAQWQEAETNLLMQTSLHREQLAAHQSEIGALKISDADHGEQIAVLRRKYHELNNKVTPFLMAVEEIRAVQAVIEERLGSVEAASRKDTAILPPPPEASG